MKRMKKGFDLKNRKKNKRVGNERRRKKGESEDVSEGED